MCGILGCFGEYGSEDVARFGSALDFLIHRGPDDQGQWQSPDLMLGHRRLSIIDLSHAGHQPMVDAISGAVLVFNGEIYNHAELRSELQKKGYQFNGHSDTEVLLCALIEWNEEAFPRLHGMWALAFWHPYRRSLLLSRDRMGEKPFYYHRDTSGHLWFSSELRSLFQTMTTHPRLSPEAFNLFLTFQYIPEPATPVVGVEQLPAGHFLKLSPGDLDVQPVAYWYPSEQHANLGEPVETIKHSLDEACRLMGTADVPVAVALSGGIDSSLVAAITARYYQKDLHAFTIGYEGRPTTDERHQAKELAKSLGIGFTEVELTDEEAINDFPRLMAYMDTPIADIAAYSYYSVSRVAHDAGYPVLLSGMGGDEFFWGYQWVRDAVKRNESYREANGWRYWLARICGRTTGKTEFFEVHSALRNGDKWSRQVLTEEARSSLEPELWLNKNSLNPDLPVHLAVINLLNRTWLRSNCLALVDRMSMANSVEVRLPLLDIDLVNNVLGMRNDGLEDWGLPHKALLVQALQDTLPTEVLKRKKRGFTPPVWRWLRGIVSRFRDLVPNGSLVRQGLLGPEQDSSFLDKFDLQFQYKLVFLECWSRLYLDGESADQMEVLARV